MNRTGVRATIALFTSLAIFGCAQLPAQDAAPSTQEQPVKPREVAPPRDQEVKPPKERPESPPQTEKHQTPTGPKDQQKPSHEQHGTSKQQGRARPAGKSARIPDQQFKANFGKQHPFVMNRVITTTTIVPNQTQFILVGYTFIFLDPWPADWLFTDECYIDFADDEYYLFDVLHPAIRVALFVVG